MTENHPNHGIYGQGRIAVIGAGAWGTALAAVMARTGRTVSFYVREKTLADDIARNRVNKKYLDNVKLDQKIHVTNDAGAALADADLVILAIPAQFMRENLRKLKPLLPHGAPLVNTAKGIELLTGNRLSAVAAEEAPANPYAVLSGPNFAIEVAQDLPAAATLAMAGFKEDAKIAETIRSRNFRPYLTDDVTGVEIAGALKNVVAIACGIVAGKNLGDNAKAAVMTRGMAEIRRFGMTEGARAETFLGLAGIGDLTLTCHSMTSRNFSLGYSLGQGKSLAACLAEGKGVAEGVATARATAQLAREKEIDMPIATAVAHILSDHASVNDVIAGLLSRHLKAEDA